ncbi:MAG: HAD-IIA family hydrolase [Actinomycetota bacterium]|nr:HAD-IIA family hydrolase [Actinomycetota bacterium]
MSGLLDEIDGVVCDLDGVIYRGDRPIEGSPDAVEELRRRGIKVVFCTNNSAPTVSEYLAKLENMGVDASHEEVVTSAVVAGEVLRDRGLAGSDALVVGGPGVIEALEQVGLEIVKGSTEVDVVAVGRDKSFDFAALDAAAEAVRSGATFIATNDDATYPGESGLEPGAGAIVAAVEVASGRRAEIVGKPHPPMMEAASRRFPPNSRLAMVGDRAETDLWGAASMGWKTVLVLSGVTSAEEAAKLEPRPDAILNQLSELTH